MVHTKIYKNITLGQILMTLMAISIMVSLFTLSFQLFGRDNPTAINKQINATNEKNKAYNKAALQNQLETEQRLESFIANSSRDNHDIIVKLDNSTTYIVNLLHSINATVHK